MNFDEEGLLTGDFRNDDSWSKKFAAVFHPTWTKLDHNSVHFLILYLIISVLGVSLFALKARSDDFRDPSQGFYSPASDIIKYETRVFPENFVNKGLYMSSEEDGLPNDETDALWDGLYQFGISHINAAEAALLPNWTTSIPNMQDEYVVELDIFHQLHCLNSLRKTLYPIRYHNHFGDYFTVNGQRNYTGIKARHYDHCIDTIRESLMCHADIATIYWQWIPSVQQPKPRLEVTHTCRNFEAIREWARGHELVDTEKNLRWLPGPQDSFQVSSSG